MNKESKFERGIRRILVPTDLTRDSDKAIDLGILLAKRSQASLTLLHVYQEPYYAMGYILGPQAGEIAPQLRTHAQSVLESLWTNVKKELPECGHEFRDGLPRDQILQYAREQDFDLIILSTHRDGWLVRVTCGCDSNEILRNAPCPVLLVSVGSEAVTTGGHYKKG